MDTPSLPASESLCRFTALAGLTLLIAAIWIPGRMAADIWQQMQAHNIEVEQLREELKWYAVKAGDTTGRLENEHSKLPLEAVRASGKLVGTKKALEQSASAVIIIIACGSILGGFGIGLAIRGFRKWRQREEWHDAILEAQARDVQKSRAEAAVVGRIS